MKFIIWTLIKIGLIFLGFFTTVPQDHLSTPVTSNEIEKIDSTYARLVALKLDSMNTGLSTYYSDGFEDRAYEIGTIIGNTQSIIFDSLSFKPSLILAVLHEEDWEQISELPYGIFHISDEQPWVGVIPALTNKGAFYSGSEPLVDAIGLHYFAHFYASEFLYDEGAAAKKPVKWLDEIATAMIQEILLNQGDKKMKDSLDNMLNQALNLQSPRFTQLAEYDKEYNGYLSTQKGAANFRWFQVHIDEKARELLQNSGLDALYSIKEVVQNIDTTRIEHNAIIKTLESKGLRFAKWHSNMQDSSH